MKLIYIKNLYKEHVTYYTIKADKFVFYTSIHIEDAFYRWQLHFEGLGVLEGYSHMGDISEFDFRLEDLQDDEDGKCVIDIYDSIDDLRDFYEEAALKRKVIARSSD